MRSLARHLATFVIVMAEECWREIEGARRGQVHARRMR
jgi:hypothetical protein